MHAEIVYIVEFVVLNPGGAEVKAADIQIFANGTKLFKTVAMSFLHESLLGVPNGTDPLVRIDEPRFTTRAIAQSNPLSSLPNNIFVTLESNIDLIPGNKILIRGFDNAISPPLISLVGGEGSNLFAVSHTSRSASFLSGEGIVELTLSNQSTLKAGQIYNFSFQVQNPSFAQKLQVSVEAVGLQLRLPASDLATWANLSILTANMTSPHKSIYGIENGTDPFFVVVPQFLPCLMAQKTP
eukprot:688464-Hanusia_phi.AAC.1